MATKKMLGLLVLFLSARSALSAEFPNELDGFKLYTEYCSGLEPMKSTVDDVKRVWGKPMEDKSGDWVLWYEKDAWKILVYIYPENGEYPSWLAGKAVQSIDFIPSGSVSFRENTFPKAFNKAHVRAADASWDEYYDAFGLAYEIYTSKPQFGARQ